MDAVWAMSFLSSKSVIEGETFPSSISFLPNILHIKVIALPTFSFVFKHIRMKQYEITWGVEISIFPSTFEPFEFAFEVVGVGGVELSCSEGLLQCYSLFKEFT